MILVKLMGKCDIFTLPVGFFACMGLLNYLIRPEKVESRHQR
jgi:hypothetical protein